LSKRFEEETRHNLGSCGVMEDKGNYAPEEKFPMKSTLAGSCLVVLTYCAAYSQSNPPAFEVASIKPAAPQPMGRMMVRMGGDAGRVDYTNVSLKDVLARAYNVKRYQITGPSWLDGERYDITAKVPDGVPKEQIPAMLQALLAERFKMTVRKESKDEPIYGLVVGKGGPKLKKSDDNANWPMFPPDGPVPGGKVTSDGPGPGGNVAVGGPGPGGKDGPGRGPMDKGSMPKGAVMMSMGGPGGAAHMQFNKATMAQFADRLSEMLDRPVVDQTGIEGNYDIALDVSMEEMAGMKRMAAGAPMGPMMAGGPGGPGGGEHGPAPDAAAPASIFSSIQALGLKLDPKKGPVDRILVEKAEKVPTEN
jgi:uncharacterized protein (TIGR03435 family)